MKQREFNKHLNACRKRVRGKPIQELDLEKLKALPLVTRRAMGLFIVRVRGPVLVDLAEALDDSWLSCCGYLYTTRSRRRPDLVFRHTAEHIIK